MPYLDFTAGQVLTAAQVDDYLMRQTVMVFDDASARTTALSGVLTEGMITFLKDTDSTEYYDGSAWQGISNPGDITAVTAGTALTGGGVSGDVTLDVDIAAVGSAVAINATQIDYTLTSSTATAYTLLTADANKYLQFTNNLTLTISTATDFAVGDQVTILTDGTANNFTTDGATMQGGGTSTTSGTVTNGGAYEAVSILCTATDTYRVIGNITAVE